MVTKIHVDMIELHTHTHTQVVSKNTIKNEIIRENCALKYKADMRESHTSSFAM